jgi:FkbM family methyltransferase
MVNKIKRISRKIKSFFPVMKGIGHVSFSQYGEDTIMLKMLQRYNIDNISYVDIGANDPINSSNTYNFYLRGYRGILIEPNITLCQKIKKVRPGDVVLNFGIGIDNQKEADFYMFGEKHTALDTFSKEDAQKNEKEGFPIQKVVKLPLRDVNEVLSENNVNDLTILSLDVEGLDEIILEKFDFEKFQPLLICVETVAFLARGPFVKQKNILDILHSKGYFIYADTHVNTIFCSTRKFQLLNGSE